MPYVSGGGQVVEKRSPWRLSLLSDAIWGAVNFVGLFFSSLFSDPSSLRGNGSASRANGGGSRPGSGNGGGPRRPMGGVNHRGTINQPMGMGGCCGGGC